MDARTALPAVAAGRRSRTNGRAANMTPDCSGRLEESAWRRAAERAHFHDLPLESGDMASIRREILIQASGEQLWDALRDVGALHTRLVPGFVTECRFDGVGRDITFANGMKARELIVDVDDSAWRVAWTAVGGPLTHHNASAQVFEEGEDACRVVWVADLLPHEMAPAIAQMIETGLAAMRRHAETPPA